MEGVSGEGQHDSGAAHPGWGRWGADDEAGAANYVDSQAVLRGIAAVRTGRAVSLAVPIRDGTGFGLVGRPDPTHHMLRSGGDYAAGLPERGGFGFADDVISLPTHSTTHVDALSHVWRDRTMYNGFSSDHVTSRGARRLGIDKMPPLVTRGIVVDCAPGSVRAPEDRVGPGELKALIADIGAELLPGDALLIRTGWVGAALAGKTDASAWPGLDNSCGDWLADRGVTLVGSDNPGVEAFPSFDPACQVPLHLALIRGHGVYFAELMALDELVAAAQNVFLFVLSPLPLVGGVGSPVAPVAVL